MGAGELNIYGDFEYKAVTRSATGAEVVIWTKLNSAWVKIDSISGREYFAAGGEQSEITSKIKAYYQKNIYAGIRFRYKTRVFDIMAVLPDNKNQWMMLMCKEVN